MRDADISKCSCYRYSLTRLWRTAPSNKGTVADGPLATWIMLNPSTADAVEDDPTIRRCRSFSEREGCAGMIVYNLFAIRSPSPQALALVLNPIGPRNDEVLRKAVEDADLIVCAWGSHGTLHSRGATVSQLLRDTGHPLHCLGINSDGSPKHPLYLSSNTSLVKWP
jgi:hypothetical protein